MQFKKLTADSRARNPLLTKSLIVFTGNYKMGTIKVLGNEIQHLLNDTIAKLSSSFMDVSSQIKDRDCPEEIGRGVENLFKSWMKANRELSEKTKKLIDLSLKIEKDRDRQEEEKRRLEALYTSGIVFTSKYEMQTLMSIAIDLVSNELNADAGFIILVNKNAEIESVITKNMSFEESDDAAQLSKSVVRNAVNQSKPVHIEDIDSYMEFTRHTSILNLGIQSALCVPLVSKEGVLGAVYLDRRENKKAFDESDLIFLLSFARQIVQGMEISQEFKELENKIVSDAALSFEEFRSQYDCSEIIGSSMVLFEVLKTAAKIAPTNASAMLLGENGTGKELLARFIHKNSRRKNGPFIAINCSAIPKDLMESELFGYEAGAFTGATKSKKGRIEFAHGGTLFLDEIGELDVNLQAKLLRVLQEQEVQRLGSEKPNKVNIRIISASNRDIATMVKMKEFREDLFYRLKVIAIRIPPLRERQEDISELCKYFLIKHEKKGKAKNISNDALNVLEHFHWPGNIRELENVILRSVILTQHETITPEDLPQELIEISTQEDFIKVGKSLSEAELEFRRLYIIQTLRTTRSKSEAAKLLGVNRTHFHRILSQLGINQV